MNFALFFLTLVISLLLTAAVYRYASRALLDIPNQRSLHAVPIPRGGGLAIGISFFSAIGVLDTMGLLHVAAATALIGGMLIMTVGWLDDHRHIPALWRLLAHSIAAAWTVYWLGGLADIDLGYGKLHLGWLGHLLAVVGIVWMINLYNFMDGIDGLAAGEAVTVALVAAGLLWWVGATELALIAALLAAACGGFLCWNWAPAKIFMGDVGSGFLGYCFAVLMLASEKADAVPVLVWIILLAVFVLDATFTLLGRIIRGESWYTAHRTHAYQRLTQGGYSHARVTGGILMVNVLVLAPIAIWVVLQPVWTGTALLGLIVAGWFVWRAVQTRFGKTSA